VGFPLHKPFFHTAYIGFRIPPFGWYRTKCLVIFEGSDSSQLTTYWSWAYPPSLWYGKSRQKTLVQCWRIQPPCFDTIVHHFRWNYSDLRGIPRKFHGKSWLVKYDNLARWITCLYCFGKGPRLEICLQKVSSQKQAYLYTLWGATAKILGKNSGKGSILLKGTFINLHGIHCEPVFRQDPKKKPFRSKQRPACLACFLIVSLGLSGANGKLARFTELRGILNSPTISGSEWFARLWHWGS